MSGEEREGNYSTGLIEEIRGEATAVITANESQQSPFIDGWEQWKPDPA